MICPKCGKLINDGLKFCPFCGAAIQNLSQPTNNQPNPQMQQGAQQGVQQNGQQAGFNQQSFQNNNSQQPNLQQSFQQPNTQQPNYQQPGYQQQNFQQGAQQGGYQQVPPMQQRTYQQGPSMQQMRGPQVPPYNTYPGNVPPMYNQPQIQKKKGPGKIIAAFIAIFVVIGIVGGALASRYFDGKRPVETAKNDKEPDIENNVSVEASTTGSSNAAESASEDVEWIDTSSEDDSFTILVYMIGSNLESGGEAGLEAGGAATRDLMEMAEGRWGDDVNLIIETGGAAEWANNAVSADKLQRFEMRDGSLDLLEELPLEQMSAQSPLKEFISYGVENYPAKRFGLILWNHGGGLLGGYGNDELYDQANMMISDVASAIKKSEAHMEFVGFDACMMATFENAYALKDCANYLIASEESESNIGWYYTDWLNSLGEDPDIETESLGRKIVDGMISSNQEFDSENEDSYNEFEDYVYEKYGVEVEYGKSATLSMIDLSKMDDVYEAWLTYLLSLKDDLDNGGFAEQSKARLEARGYGDIKEVDPYTGNVTEMHYDMVDLLDYIDKTHLTGSFDLEKTIRDCIAYENSQIPGSNGLSVYIPYYLIELYQPLAIPELEAIGLDDDYLSYFDLFCSYMASGNTDIEYEGDSSNNITASASIPDYLEFEEENDQYVLTLTEDQINEIASISVEGGFCSPYYTDEDGNEHYAILAWGENVCKVSVNENDHIIASWDGMLSGIESLDDGGDAYPFFVVYDSEYNEDGSLYSIQLIPAVLNDTDYIYIIVENTFYSIDNYESDVIGYMYTGQNEAGNRSVFTFQEGDNILMYNYGYYLDDEDPSTVHVFTEYYDEITVGANGLDGFYNMISDEHKGTQENCYRYIITDIYGNQHYTEWLFY
jgi:hypothetical protein